MPAQCVTQRLILQLYISSKYLNPDRKKSNFVTYKILGSTSVQNVLFLILSNTSVPQGCPKLHKSHISAFSALLRNPARPQVSTLQKLSCQGGHLHVLCDHSFKWPEKLQSSNKLIFLLSQNNILIFNPLKKDFFVVVLI